MLSTLQHPRVVRLLGACMRPPLFALVQELAAGSLSDLLRGRTDPLPMEQLVQIATDVAEAMVYLHPKVVHRDLKPHNVLLDADGRAMVCDFGIARLHDCTSLSTTTGGAAGTPCYMAPEMFSQERVGPAVDVFAFGIMLWQMATCQEPWSELNSPVEVCAPCCTGGVVHRCVRTSCVNPALLHLADHLCGGCAAAAPAGGGPSRAVGEPRAALLGTRASSQAHVCAGAGGVTGDAGGAMVV